MRDHVLQRRATDSGGDLLHECLELARRQLPETYGRSLVGDELQKLGDGGEVIRSSPGSQPAERRQVLLISRELVWSFWRALAWQKAPLVKVRFEGARHGGEIGIILRTSRRADLKICATDRRKGTETATEPPQLQSTSGAQMAPNRDARVATDMQPARKATQDRTEQS
jgi:hypothetical protein